MAKSYSSNDLRKKVITYVKQGNSCNKASIKFDISSNTVSNWYKRCKSEGRYLSRKVGGKQGRGSPEDITLYMALLTK